MGIIRYLSYALRVLLFLLFLAFAARNTEPVTLNFFLGQTWQPPLIVLLLIFMITGAALGVIAWLPRVFRDKREIQALRKRLGETESAAGVANGSEPPVMAPPVDAVL